jgi:diguanylate cyclase (GGDEF)-like protein
VEGKTVGVLGFSSREVREPDERLLEATRVIGSQIGQFLQRKQAEQELRRAEVSLRRSNRALLVIGRVSQALIQGEDEGHLVDTVCRVLLDTGGYRLAWIGFVDRPDSAAIRCVARGGMQGSAAAQPGFQESDPRETLGPALKAIQTGTVQVCRYIPTDPQMDGLRSDALARGYASSIFVPLMDEMGVQGIMSIASAEEDAFDADEVSLLQELAAKLCFGIALHRSNVEHERAVARADRLALFDALTELPNRAQLLQDIGLTAQQCKPDSPGFSVLAIDIPRIETLKTNLGFGASDTLVMTIATRLKDICTEQELAARLEGGEFAVRLDPGSSGNADAVLERARRIRAALELPCLIGATEVMPHCVIGIAIFPADGSDAQALLERAQTARISTGGEQGSGISFFGLQRSEHVMRELGLESALRHAAKGGELQLLYQPEVDLRSGEIVAVEALLRWNSSQFGDVMPSEFIPLAERSDLILSIGDWVLRQACRQAAVWRAAGLAAPRIAVNLSLRQLERPGFAARLQSIVLECGADPSWLGLEVTESMLIGDSDNVSTVLRRLKALGFEISLDDFGTGYSSLSRMQEMPIDIVKVDRKFVPDVTAGSEGVSVTRAIITMAHSLQMRVLAEGVESEGQLNLLAAHGCDLVQGYFFSRPVPAAALEAMVRENRRLPARFLTGSKGSRTLLLVDDEENILSSLRRLLRRDGYQIVCARSATEGLQRLAESQVDVILSDQRMPGMTGVEFLRCAKDLYPDTVRMVLSGFTDLQSVIDAVNEGAIYKFLTKPWDDERIRAHISEAFRQKEMADENRRLAREIEEANGSLEQLNQELHKSLEQQSNDSNILQRSADSAREILDGLPAAIIGVDAQGLITFVSSGTFELLPQLPSAFGRPAANALPPALMRLLREEDRSARRVEFGDRRFHAMVKTLRASETVRGRLLVLFPVESICMEAGS